MSLEPEGRRRLWIGVALAAAGAVTLLRVALINRLADRGFFVKYVRFADGILAGHIPRARLGDISPGYLWTMVALRRVHATPHQIIVLQIVAVTLAALFVALCAARIAGPVAAMSAAVILLSNRAALVCATELEPETLILLMSSIGLAAIGAFASRRSARSADTSGPGASDTSGLCGTDTSVCAVSDRVRTGSSRTTDTSGPGASDTSGLCGTDTSVCAVSDRGRTGSARSSLAIAGVAFGLAAICRPVALLVIAGLTVWIWQRARAKVTWFIVSAAVPILAVIAVNAALSGEPLIMDPGTVFFEGMNPLATGLAGVQPRIVNDLEATSSEPDFLHVAYRIVAARATGTPMNRSASNHYWSSKAWSFVRWHLVAASRLKLRKILLACQSYDPYDLSTMVRKSEELGHFPWLPFGFVLALAVTSLARVERQAPRAAGGGGPQAAPLTPIVIFTLANATALIAFYVTARMRNAVLPGLAVLAGVGVAVLVDLFRTNRPRALLISLTVVASTLVLGIEGLSQREDRHNWDAAFEAGKAARAARAAAARGATTEAFVLQAIAATFRPADPNTSDPRLLRGVALERLKDETAPESRFDLAIALQSAGDWVSSAKVLDELAADGYRPRRENRVVSSVAYYQARAALRRGDVAAARRHLAIAAHEAPGDPYVLALRASLDPQSSTSRSELDDLYDPYTASLAMAQAQADTGDARGAKATLAALVNAFPEWPRPRGVAATMH